MVDHGDRLAEVLDQVELVAGEQDGAGPSGPHPGRSPRGWPRRAGRGPENGSSSTSTSGSCTRAAASWTRCWLPSESFSTGSPARSARPEPLEQLVRAPAGLALLDPGQPGEVDELVAHPHVGVEAPLLRHVAEAAALLDPELAAVVAHRPAVGRDDPEDDPHGGGLPRPVRPEQARPPGRGTEVNPSRATRSPYRLVRPSSSSMARWSQSSPRPGPAPVRGARAMFRITEDYEGSDRTDRTFPAGSVNHAMSGPSPGER